MSPPRFLADVCHHASVESESAVTSSYAPSLSDADLLAVLGDANRCRVDLLRQACTAELAGRVKQQVQLDAEIREMDKTIAVLRADLITRPSLVGGLPAPSDAEQMTLETAE